MKLSTFFFQREAAMASFKTEFEKVLNPLHIDFSVFSHLIFLVSI